LLIIIISTKSTKKTYLLTNYSVVSVTSETTSDPGIVLDS